MARAFVVNTNHPIKMTTLEERVENYARSEGSKAKTIKRQLRAFMACPKHVVRKRIRDQFKPKTWNKWCGPGERWHKRHERKQDPELYRALADSAFRKRLVRRLQSEAKRLTKMPKDLDQLGGKVGASYFLAETRLRQIGQRIELMGSKAKSAKLPTPEELEAAGFHLIAIHSNKEAKRIFSECCFAGKDAMLIVTHRPSYHLHIPGETEWNRRGKPIGYTRATNDNHVRAVAQITSPKRLEYLLHEKRGSVVLPDGYEWRHDANGLHVFERATGADYHISASDLLSRAKEKFPEILAKLTDRREHRLKVKARRAAERAEMKGVWVSVRDSLNGGNCKTGTLAFAKRHGLSLTRHYEARQLFAIANGDVGRVRLAITAALIRHERDMERGYSTLEDLTLTN